MTFEGATWCPLTTLFHATDQEELKMAEQQKVEQSETISKAGPSKTGPIEPSHCSEVSNHTISSFTSNCVFIPTSDILESSKDFLIPLQRDIFLSVDGRTYVEFANEITRRSTTSDSYCTR